MEKGAQFSDCRKYRYALWRFWDRSLPFIMFIGLNPSTANENDDDATIRRVIGFAKEWTYGGVYMCNLFPYVSTNPNDLNEFGNTKENQWALKLAASDCSDVFFAWGNFSIVKEKGRDKELAAMFPNAKCLIKNKNGSPRHPLYVPLNIQPVNWI